MISDFHQMDKKSSQNVTLLSTGNTLDISCELPSEVLLKHWPVLEAKSGHLFASS